MGIAGQWVKTFAEANLACAVDVHMNSDVPFFWDVVEVKADLAGSAESVRLRNHNGGEIIERPVERTKRGTEQVSIKHSGSYEAIFGTKPMTVYIQPFKGEKF